MPIHIYLLQKKSTKANLSAFVYMKAKVSCDVYVKVTGPFVFRNIFQQYWMLLVSGSWLLDILLKGNWTEIEGYCLSWKSRNIWRNYWKKLFEFYESLDKHIRRLKHYLKSKKLFDKSLISESIHDKSRLAQPLEIVLVEKADKKYEMLMVYQAGNL